MLRASLAMVIIFLIFHVLMISQVGSEQNQKFSMIYYHKKADGKIAWPDVIQKPASAIQCAALCFRSSGICNGFSLTKMSSSGENEECRVAFGNLAYAEENNSSLYIGDLILQPLETFSLCTA